MNLLEKLALESGCPYLSDLHRPEMQRDLQTILEGLEPEGYSLQEWNEALAYIAGLRTPYSSCAEAYQALKAYAAQINP